MRNLLGIWSSDSFESPEDMHIYRLIIVLVFLGPLAIAQRVPEIQIEWGGIQEYTSDDISVNVPHFKGATYHLPDTRVPYFCATYDLSVTGVINVELYDVITENLTARELSLVDVNELTNEFELESSSSGWNGKPFLGLCVQTMRLSEEGVVEKIGFGKSVLADSRQYPKVKDKWICEQFCIGKWELV